MAKRKGRQPSNEPALVRQDGALFVNFVNTASARRKSVKAYADLIAWGLGSGVVGTADAQRLERAAGERPADAEAVSHKTIALARFLRHEPLQNVLYITGTSVDFSQASNLIFHTLKQTPLTKEPHGMRTIYAVLS